MTETKPVAKKDEAPVEEAFKGDQITIPCPERVRVSDQVYRVIDIVPNT